MPQESSKVFYSVYVPGHDAAVLFHGPFYELRRRFFEKGQRTRTQGTAFISGVETSFSGVMSKSALKWEVKAGNCRLERAYPEKNGYFIVYRNLNHNIVAKATYQKNHAWAKTAYFLEGNTVQPILIVEPADDEGGILFTEYHAQSRSYSQKKLFPCLVRTGTRAHSLLNATVGEPMMYASGPFGDFCYYDEEGLANQRRMLTEKIEKGEIESIPFWPDEPAEESQAISILDEADAEFENDEPAAAKKEAYEAQTGGRQPAWIHETFQYYGDTNEKGERHGFGRTEQENGYTTYEGDYQEGKRHGNGVYFYKNGRPCYIGHWEEDRRNGTGVSFRKNKGDIHIGHWKDGVLSGTSAVFDENGELRYIGRMENGLRREMTILYKDNLIYVGRWRDDQPTGEGALFNEDGKLVYNGSWHSGKREGQGVSFDSQGNMVFSGEWKENQYYNGISYQKLVEE